MTTPGPLPRSWSLRDVMLGPPAQGKGLIPSPRPDPDQPNADLMVTLARHVVVGADQVIDRLSDAGRRAVDVAVARALEQVLDIDLGALISSAWRAHHALVDAARRTLAAPGTEEIVQLATHGVTSEHHPYFDLLVDQVPVARIELEITLEITLQAVLAVVRGGRLAEIRAGHGELSATLAAADVELLSRSGAFQLRDHHQFRQPMPLIPAAA